MTKIYHGKRPLLVVTPEEISELFEAGTGSNSHFELLRGVEREVAMEALEHEGEELHPAGKT